MKQISVLIFILSLALSSKSADTTRVLFIGNSYTYVNDLPNTFRLLGESSGKIIIIDSHAPGGYTLNQHSTDATVLSKIAQGNWDYVILQEQSQRPAFPPNQVEQDVFPYADKLDSLIHAADSCTKTVFYMTWGRKYGDASNCGNYAPLCTYNGMQMRLRDSYLQMASNNQAMTAPAGMAWKNSWYSDSTINLWSGDNSHPSVAGTYLTACTFFATIFRQSPNGLTYLAGLPTSTASFLQQKATETVLDSLSRWISYYDMESASIQYVISPTNPLQINFGYDGGYANTVLWDFGDGTTSTEQFPSHLFTESGIYEVTRYVESFFCRADSVTTILDLSTVGLFSSNLISPKTLITKQEIRFAKPNLFSLYNLQGELIFESKLLISTFNFKALKTGMYFYIATIDGKNEIEKFIVE